MHAQAQSPGHITGFFVIYSNGSTGAGINIAEGMRTSVRTAKKDGFLMNGKKSHLLVSIEVLRIFRKKTGIRENVSVRHRTKFPIGYGLGISGAGALSLCLALDRLFGTRLGRKKMTEMAKAAEIKCGTGLGDVVAENYAGLLLGKKPYPSESAQQIKCAEKYVVLGFFNPIKTKSIIRSAAWKRRINSIGLWCMKRMQVPLERKMEIFLDLSRIFTMESGLATEKIRRVMAEIGNASMSMLGETIFIPTNEPRETRKLLKKFCKRVLIAKISAKGAGVL